MIWIHNTVLKYKSMWLFWLKKQMSRILNIKYIGRQKHQTFPKKEIFGFKKLWYIYTEVNFFCILLNIRLAGGVIKTSAYCVSRRIVFETFMLSFQFVPISRRTSHKTIFISNYSLTTKWRSPSMTDRTIFSKNRIRLGY